MNMQCHVWVVGLKFCSVGKLIIIVHCTTAQPSWNDLSMEDLSEVGQDLKKLSRAAEVRGHKVYVRRHWKTIF